MVGVVGAVAVEAALVAIPAKEAVMLPPAPLKFPVETACTKLLNPPRVVSGGAAQRTVPAGKSGPGYTVTCACADNPP